MKTKQMKKRIRSMILALVIGICCIVPAAPAMKTEAATLKDVAKKIDMNGYNQVTLKKEKREVVLKIVLKSKGTFEMSSTAGLAGGLTFDLYDSQLVKIGSDYKPYGCNHKSSEDLIEGDLKAGTYYLRIYKNGYMDEDMSAVYYFGFNPSKAPSIDISISLKKKKSIQLGAVFNNCSKKKLIWKSSKKKVATVTSKGKVTAKKKGTAIITVFTPDGEQSRIKVVVK